MTEAKASTGTVVAIRGGVIDVAFGGGRPPQIDEALVVEWDRAEPLIVEVQSHLDERTVRGIALHATAGLMRQTPVRATGSTITVPVGGAVLRRLLDVAPVPAHKVVYIENTPMFA